MNNLITGIMMYVMISLSFLGGLFGTNQTEDVMLQEEVLEEAKEVLYISSYSYELSVVGQQLDGIRKRFEGQAVTIDVEFMDTKRFTEEEHYENFYNHLKYKINRDVSYDAVIVGDDNGLQFLLDNKEDLFPDTPIFFLGINSLDRALEASSDSQFTGVLEEKTFYESIELALEMTPDANRLILIKDSTLSSQAEYDQIIMYEKDFPNLEFITADMSTMTPDEYFSYMSELDLNDICFNLAAVTFSSGEVWTFVDVQSKQIEAMSTPVYGSTTAGIGDGLFGGHVLSHEDQGYAAADMVMRYFHGTPMEEIEFVAESPNVDMLDYALFDDFGFHRDDIPEGVILINYEETYWEIYGNLIIFGIIVFIIETVIIIALILNVRGNRKKAKQLSDTIEELNFANVELKDRVAEVNERDTKIKEMIYFDELTGLMTRYAIGEQIRKFIEDENNKIAVMLLDVDNFKNINDGFGHSFGDQVLRIIGERLDRIANHRVSISRFGGDEFLLVVKEYESDEWLHSIVEKVQEVFKEVMHYENTNFVLTTSIGITKFPEHGNNYGELLKRADVALHYSKDSGKDTATMYEVSMEVNFQDKVYFQNLLRKAFAEEEFYLNFQPLISIKEKRIYGFEALIRWRSKELGYVSPFKLITEAEEMGLIIKLGEWIFKQSFAFAEMINKNTEKPISISINISAIQLMYSEFAKRLIEIIESYDLKPENIILEMTETTLINDIEAGKSVINQLRDYGVRISLDDFGTGYSSLSYLKNFAIDVLKVDKSFIDQIVDSAYDRYLVEAVLKIAKERKIATVAEGVETVEQLNTLREMECDSIQGYLFSKPLSLEDASQITDKEIIKDMI